MSRLFMPSANAEAVTVKRGEEFSLNLAPAEVDKATGLISIALGMEELDPLPSHIKDQPFVIRFFEDNTLALERTEGEGSLPFKWAEADELIVALQDGLKCAVNERTLIKGPRGTGASRLRHEPFV